MCVSTCNIIILFFSDAKEEKMSKKQCLISKPSQSCRVDTQEMLWPTARSFRVKGYEKPEGIPEGRHLNLQGSWEEPQKREGKTEGLPFAFLKPILAEFCNQ